MTGQAVLDVRPLDLATARAVGQVAQQLATDSAERAARGFGDRARAAILAKLAEGPASGEDLTDHVRACGIPFRDGRALGGVIGKLSRDGLIHVVGTCSRRHGHGTAGGLIWDLCQTYEAQKAAWLAANPAASSEQVEAACQAIAERLGV